MTIESVIAGQGPGRLPWSGDSSLRQFFEDWRRERDPNYTTDRRDFQLRPGAVPVTWGCDGPYLILEEGRQMVRGYHSHGYVGGGSSYGGTRYRRMPAPETFVVTVATNGFEFNLKKMDGKDPLDVVRSNQLSTNECIRHAPVSVRFWQVVTPEELGREIPYWQMRPRWGRRYTMLAGNAVFAYEMTPQSVVDFVCALPCAGIATCERFKAKAEAK